MKRAGIILGTVIFAFCTTAQAEGKKKTAKKTAPPPAAEACVQKPEPFRLMPEVVTPAPPPSLTEKLDVAPQPTGKTAQQRLKLESNDDLAALSFPGDHISPYVGASIDLLPLPNYDPASATQVLAYGLGAGFGCDLGSTRLSLRYQFRLFPEGGLLGKGPRDEEEIHRISLGLQKSF